MHDHDSPKHWSVLIVDDNEEHLFLLETMLKRLGHEVTVASDGRQAMDKLGESGIDLIISDILMPVMDGYQLCREVRADERTCNIPFVFYTSTYLDKKDEYFALKLGADRFLRKPMDFGEFVKHLQELMEEVGKPHYKTRQPEIAEEREILKLYNERLVKKLENKMQDLEREMNQRKLADEETRRLATVVRDTNDAITVQDFEGRITAWNHGAELMYGYSEEEALEMNNGYLTPPAKEEEQKEFTCRLIAGETVTSFETKRVTKDGRILDVWLTVTKLVDDAGKPIAIATTERDITEHTRAEEALRQSEERYRSLFENSIIGIYRADPTGRLVMANPALLGMLGFDNFEEIQNTASEDTGFYPIFAVALQRKELREKGRVMGLEKVWHRRDGTHVHVRQSLVAHSGPEGRLESYEGTIEDITHLKELEEQFLQAQKMDALGRLAGGIAHDFNNVLMALMSYSDLMLRALPGDDPLTLYAQEIKKATERAADLTGKLLAFSRRQVVQTRPIQLNAVIKESLGMLRPLLREDVEVSIRLQPDLPAVLADPNQVIQVLTNLAVNARDAMPHGGILSLHTRTVLIGPDGDPANTGLRPGPYIELIVSDSGCGMSPEVMQRAFEPFFTTKAEGKGTGLGLSTCFGIVKQFRGDIQIDSRPGQGTRVMILFPLCSAPVERNTPPPIPPIRAQQQGTLLLVEDEQAVRTVLAEILGMQGYTIIEAMNAEEALRKAEQMPRVDCLITDVVMPLMSGPELIARLTEQRPALKVILMSGHAGEDLSPHYNERGFMFLQKPFSSDTLLRLVQEILTK